MTDTPMLSVEAFSQKLRDKYDKLDPANAPVGKTCPHCALANPTAAPSGDRRRFLAQCSAVVVLPAFVGRVYDPQEWSQLDLALFDPACSYAEKLNARDCLLFVKRTAND